MKTDLLKSLRENLMFQYGISQMPEAEREIARAKIEALVSELSEGFSAFVDQIQQANEETREKIRQSVKDDNGLVIDENQLDGSQE